MEYLIELLGDSSGHTMSRMVLQSCKNWMEKKKKKYGLLVGERYVYKLIQLDVLDWRYTRGVVTDRAQRKGVCASLKTPIITGINGAHRVRSRRVVLRNYPDVSGKVHQLVIYDLPKPMGFVINLSSIERRRRRRRGACSRDKEAKCDLSSIIRINISASRATRFRFTAVDWPHREISPG